ncbi:MAG TPA: creatininase family protein [Acidobacteriota bacterium]|nr:creatininase family protein [Acidobacteriota bacterium]
MLLRITLVCLCLLSGLAAQGGTAEGAEPPFRDLDAINWMDFAQWVPDRIDTVLLPVGTLEAHGVVNNGADNTVPAAMARDLAPRLNAMYAPVIAYGVTTSLSAFPGTFKISEPVFKAYCKEVMAGLQRTGFRNIIVINGHGPNFGPLSEAAAELSEETGVRTLVFNWWSYTADVTKEVYGTDGGHSGVNENAAVLATTPEYVREELYDPQQAWWRQDGASAYPFPSSIILYQPEEGYPDFDKDKADRFYSKVLDKVEKLVRTTIEKWKLAGL